MSEYWIEPLFRPNLPLSSTQLTLLPLQFDPEFQTPLILDESLDYSDPEESRFVGALSDGLLAKSEPFLSMSAFQKPQQAALLGRLTRGAPCSSY